MAQPTGICGTCDHVNACGATSGSCGPVLACEEFTTERDLAPALKATTVGPETMAPSSTVFQGLCQTCEHRETCTLARTPGGIWQCEEFA